MSLLEQGLRRWERTVRADGRLGTTEMVLNGWLCAVLDVRVDGTEPDWAPTLRRGTWKTLGLRAGLLALTDQRLTITGPRNGLMYDLARLGVVTASLPTTITVEVLTNPVTTFRLDAMTYADATDACQRIEEAREQRWKGLNLASLDPVHRELGDDIANEMKARGVLADPQRSAQTAAATTLAGLLSKRGHVVEAEALYRAAAADPSDDLATFTATMLGNLLRDYGDETGAESAYRDALARAATATATATAEDTAMAWLELGRLAAARSDIRSAREAFDRALAGSSKPLHAETLREFGKLCDQQGETAEAEAMYRRLIDLGCPTWTQIGQINLAGLLRRAGDRQAATELYRAVLASDENNLAAAAGITLGALRREQGRADEAASVYQQVID